MPNYRRSYAAGGTYFFTVNLADRGSCVLTDHIEDLRAAVRFVRSRRPFEIEAMVILPDHLHSVWALPVEDSDFPTRWKEIKACFTKWTGLSGARSRSQAAKGERGLWQRRYWEHQIRDERDFRAHVMYCWGNPVKHGLVGKAVEWPYSSIHRDIRLGRVPSEWGAPMDGEFGERRGA